MEIKGLRVDQREAPLGVDSASPSFSFSAEREGVFWISLFREGMREAEQECTVTSAESSRFSFRRPLTPCTRYRWEVSDGKHTAGAYFETGVDFSYRFIAPQAMTQAVPLFCRSFYAPREICRARLYHAGTGRCCAFLNGVRVGVSEQLSQMHMGYRTYDVGDLLWQDAENELEIFLGGGQGTSFAAALVMVDKNGKRVTVETDANWRVLDSGREYHPQTGDELWKIPIDRRFGRIVYLEKADRLPPVSEPRVAVGAILRPSVRRAELHGMRVLDLGRLIEGYVRYRGMVKKGSRVRFLCMKRLTDPIETARCFAFVADGSTHLYEPLFFHARFRYVLVEGDVHEPRNTVEAVEVKAIPHSFERI